MGVCAILYRQKYTHRSVNTAVRSETVSRKTGFCGGKNFKEDIKNVSNFNEAAS